MRGYAKSGVVDAIRAAGGELFAVTSEPQSLATEAEEGWELGFASVGDPHHEILGTCRDRGWLDLFRQSAEALQRERSWVSHPLGYFQPGVLALAHEGRVLYRWRCRPTRQNVGGAAARPKPEYTWKEIQSRLGDDCTEPELDASPELDMRPPPWPLFVLLLLAHGWFRRPRPFPLGRDGDTPSANPPAMIPRVLVFLAAWAAAFAFLPAGWVALALLAWGALVGPSVVALHRNFQNVPTGEPEPI